LKTQETSIKPALLSVHCKYIPAVPCGCDTPPT
jgi:hypothetical protein